MFSISSCSGEITANVMPKRVSGLVVKTSNKISEPLTFNSNCAPSDFPIQFFCIVLTFSGQFPIFSNPVNNSSE